MNSEVVKLVDDAFFEDAKNLLEQDKNKESPEYLCSYSYYLTGTGRYKKSGEVLSQVHDRSSLSYLSAKAALLFDTQQFSKLIPLLENLIEDHDSDTHKVMLGEVYCSVYDFGSVEALLPTLIEQLPTDSAYWATCVNEYGVCLLRLGKTEEGEKLINEATLVREALYKIPHPSLGESYVSCAYLAGQQGDSDKHSEYFAKAVYQYEKSVGPTHPLMGLLLNNQGANLFDREKKHQEGISTLEGALAFTEERPLIRALILRNLSIYYMQRGNKDKMYDARDAAKTIIDEQYSMFPGVISEHYTELAYLESCLSDYSNSLKLAQTALEQERKANRTRSEKIFENLLLVSGAQRELGELEEALDSASEALEIAEREVLDDRVTALCVLAHTYSAQNRQETADEYLSKAKELDDSLGNIRSNLVHAIEVKFRYGATAQSEIKLYEQLKWATNENAGKRCTAIYNRLADLYFSEGQPIRALFTAKEALKILEVESLQDTEDYYGARLALAESLYLLEEADEAKRIVFELADKDIICVGVRTRLYPLLAEFDEDNRVDYALKTLQCAEECYVNNDYTISVHLPKLWLASEYAKKGEAEKATSLLKDAREDIKNSCSNNRNFAAAIKSIEGVIENPEKDFRMKMSYREEKSQMELLVKYFTRSLVAVGLLGAFTAGSITNAIAFVSAVVLHEIGHLVSMKKLGSGSVDCFFFSMFSTSSYDDNVAKEQEGKYDLLCELAGPLPGLIWLLLTVGLLRVMEINFNPSEYSYQSFFWLLACVNIVTLLPVLPLDGGRILGKLFFLEHPKLEYFFSATILSLLFIFSFSVLTPTYWFLVGALLIALLLKSKYFFAQQEIMDQVVSSKGSSLELIESISAAKTGNLRVRATAQAGVFKRLTTRGLTTRVKIGVFAVYLAFLLGTIPLLNQFGQSVEIKNEFNGFSFEMVDEYRIEPSN